MQKEDSKRVKALRQKLLKIPRFPNDKASKQALEAKSLTDLLIVYISWRLRLVAQRPRAVTGLDRIADDPRAAGLAPKLNAFVRAAEAGDDLTPYLSNKAHTKGYTPAAELPGGNSWADKDFLLNVMGLHHFHLGLARERKGHMTRTDDVLFASVSRDTVDILGLYHHGAFEYETSGTMTPERERLWSAFTARQEAGTLPGQLMRAGYGVTGIAASGRPIAVVLAAQLHARILRQIDPQLDDASYVRSLFRLESGPDRPKLRWEYNYLDFGLVEETSGTFGIFSRGPN